MQDRLGQEDAGESACGQGSIKGLRFIACKVGWFDGDARQLHASRRAGSPWLGTRGCAYLDEFVACKMIILSYFKWQRVAAARLSTCRIALDKGTCYPSTGTVIFPRGRVFVILNNTLRRQLARRGIAIMYDN